MSLASILMSSLQHLSLTTVIACVAMFLNDTAVWIMAQSAALFPTDRKLLQLKNTNDATHLTSTFPFPPSFHPRSKSATKQARFISFNRRVWQSYQDIIHPIIMYLERRKNGGTVEWRKPNNTPARFKLSTISMPMLIFVLICWMSTMRTRSMHWGNHSSLYIKNKESATHENWRQTKTR